MPASGHNDHGSRPVTGDRHAHPPSADRRVHRACLRLSSPRLRAGRRGHSTEHRTHDAARDHRPPLRRELDEAAGDRSRGADSRSGRQRVRCGRRRTGGARARRSGAERLSAATRSCSSTTRRRRKSSRSTPKAPRRSWRRSSGTRRTTTASFPSNDGLLPATVPGVVDAWYTLLDRWGTMTLRAGPAAGDRDRRAGIPADARARASMKRAKLQKYPTSVKLYQPDGMAPKAGDIFKNPDAGRTAAQADRGREAGSGERTPRGALTAARDRFYKGDIAKTMAEFSEENGGAVPLRRLRELYRQGRDAGLHQLSRLRRLQEPVGEPGPGGALRAEHPRRLRPEEDGAQQRRRTSTRAPKR